MLKKPQSHELNTMCRKQEAILWQRFQLNIREITSHCEITMSLALDSDSLNSTLNSSVFSWVVLGEHLTLLTMSTLPIFDSFKYIPKEKFPGFPWYFETRLSHNQSTQEAPARVCAPEVMQQSWMAFS